MTKHSAEAPQRAKSFAELKRVIDFDIAAAKRDLAQWLDQRPRPKDPTVVTVALLETALDRYLLERAATPSNLSAAAADALDMIQPVLRRAVQRRRAALRIDESRRAAALTLTDEQCLKRLSDMLTLLDALADSQPRDAVLRQFIDETAEPLASLAGYFAGGIDKPAAFDTTEPSRWVPFPVLPLRANTPVPEPEAENRSTVTPRPVEDR